MKESNTYFVDTNIFIRTIINEDDAVFRDCVTFFEGVKSNKYRAITAGIVLAEIVWTLLSFYKVSKAEVVEAVSAVENMRGLAIIDDYNIETALRLFKNHNVKFVDCMIASSRKLNNEGIAIVSFDKDFDKLGIARKEPCQILK